MQWSDVTAAPRVRTLRQFAGLWLLFFSGLAGWRAWQGQVDGRTEVFAGLGLLVGVIGWTAARRDAVIVPARIRSVCCSNREVLPPRGFAAHACF